MMEISNCIQIKMEKFRYISKRHVCNEENLWDRNINNDKGLPLVKFTLRQHKCTMYSWLTMVKFQSNMVRWAQHDSNLDHGNIFYDKEIL